MKDSLNSETDPTCRRYLEFRDRWCQMHLRAADRAFITDDEIFRGSCYFDLLLVRRRRQPSL